MTTDNLARNREYVRHCRAKYSQEKKKYANLYYIRSWTAWVGRKVGSAISEDRIKSRDCDISRGFVSSLLEQQNFKCAITGLGLRHDKSLFSMSIDRINNKYGHTKDNVQLICMGLNLAKNRQTDGDVKHFLRCVKDPTLFVPERVSRDYVSSCVRNGRQSDAGKGLLNNIDTDFVLKLYDQNVYCSISGVPLAVYSHPCLSLSIDRIDNSIGHVRGNVALVAKAVNRMRGRRHANEVLEWLGASRQAT